MKWLAIIIWAGYYKYMSTVIGNRCVHVYTITNYLAGKLGWRETYITHLEGTAGGWKIFPIVTNDKATW